VKASSTSSANNSSRRRSKAQRQISHFSSPLNTIVGGVRKFTSYLSGTIITALGGNGGFIDDGYDPVSEISSLRARELKRRLGRDYGYLNSELDRMIHKNEIINALAYEMLKQHQKRRKIDKQKSIQNALFITIGLTILWLCRPLVSRLWDVCHVNLVVIWDVTSDRVRTCAKYRSLIGLFGVLVLTLLDLLKLWLSASVLISWFIKGRRWYLFPTPNFSVYPGAVLGGNPEMAVRGGAAGMSSWGVNIMPMLIRWAMTWAHHKVEGLVGRTIAAAKRRKKDARHERKKKKKAAMATKSMERNEAVEEKFDSTDRTGKASETPSSQKNHREELYTVEVNKEFSKSEKVSKVSTASFTNKSQIDSFQQFEGIDEADFDDID